MPKTRGLTLKQQRFVDAYLGEARGNGVAAARIAGYSGNDKTLSVVSSENLAKPSIVRELSRQTGVILDRDQVLGELSGIAQAPIAERIKTSEKLKALELLGRFHRIFEPEAAAIKEPLEHFELAVILRSALTTGFNCMDIGAMDTERSIVEDEPKTVIHE
jgi:hypothetical protein